MKSKFTWIFTLFMVLAVQLVSAQEKTVTGTVTDADFGDPIPGVSVLLEGTQYGTETDMDGKYSINARPGQRLVFKFTGFADMYMTVGQSDVLNVVMVESVDEALEELVIEGYRNVAKEKSSTASTTVSAKTIEGRPNASILQRLQGQIPGLSISTGSGQPGSNDTSVILRGLGSINGAVEPLYVIDGIPVSSDRFRSLNPNDFESVTVLKDAGATAIYGNRGANGVIVINTKRGSFDSALQIKYVGTTGVSSLQKNDYNMMNAEEALEYTGYTRQMLGLGGTNYDTNWQDVFFRNAISQDHTLSFTAGAKNLSTYTSVGYADYEGALKNTGLKRFSFVNNLNGKNDNGRLTFGTTVSANYSKSNIQPVTGSATFADNFFFGSFIAFPFYGPDQWDGTYEGLTEDIFGLPGGAGVLKSPFMLMDRMKNYGRTQDEFKLVTGANINYDLGSGFSVGSRVGVDYQTISQFTFDDPSSYLANYSKPDEQIYRGSTANVEESRVLINTTTNLTWQKELSDKSSLSIAGYVEYLKGHFKSSSYAKEGYDPYFFDRKGDTGSIPDNEDNDFYVPTAGLSIANAGLFSYFGIASYDYDTKYGLEATVRRDASFRFVDDYKWGTFWSVSGRWNISNEDFMSGSVFNDLKLRASYGTAGNQDITGGGVFGGAYLYETVYGTASGYNNHTSLVLAQLPNRALQWESITTTNIGLDFGVFENRLRGSVDVYRKQTDDLYQNVPLSAINGTTGLMSNYGAIRNEGIEVIVAGDVIRNENTRLTLNFNGAYNKNSILDIPHEGGFFWNGSSLTAMQEGDMLGQFYLHEFKGVDSNTGEAIFYDKDGNETTTPRDEDLRLTGKSYMPKYVGSFGFDFEHKGWFLQANFTYAQDVYRYDNDYFFLTFPGFNGAINQSNDARDIWTQPGDIASIPSASASNLDYFSGSSFYLRDASYVRLRYLTLGHSFAPKSLEFIGLTGLRVYAQAENLVTWSKWKGWDAESNRGVDMAQYPTPKTVSFGVEVQF